MHHLHKSLVDGWMSLVFVRILIYFTFFVNGEKYYILSLIIKWKKK